MNCSFAMQLEEWMYTEERECEKYHYDTKWKKMRYSMEENLVKIKKERSLCGAFASEFVQ